MSNVKTDSKAIKAKGETTVKDDEKVLHIPLSEIHVDHAWNARSGKITVVAVPGGNPLTGDMEFDGLVNSIKVDGQDIPVIVRPRKGAKPYELVAGFRRYEAINAIGQEKGEKGNQTTIMAVCRTLTDAQARALNVRENTVRDGLSGPDLAWAIADMAKPAKPGDPPLADLHIANQIGKNQAYVGTLHRIIKGLMPELFATWRAGGVEIGYKKLDEIAKLPQAEQAEAFSKACKGKEGAAKGPGAWIDTAVKKAKEYGGFIGKLHRAEVLDASELHWNECVLYVIPDKKEAADVTKEARKAIRDGFKEGFTVATAEETAEEIEEGAEA